MRLVRRMSGFLHGSGRQAQGLSPSVGVASKAVGGRRLEDTVLDDEADFGPAAPTSARTTVIACGAVANELLAVIRRYGWTHVAVECLPGKLHNTPQFIPERIERKIEAAKARGDDVFVMYGDCGTGGLLDRVLERHGVDRVPGDHCYQFFAGFDTFARLHEDDPASFYLTDFLCRHFDRFIVKGLKLDSHPELLPQIFGNYRRLIYLAQTDDEALQEKAQRAAEFLGLAYEYRATGFGDLERSLLHFLDDPAAQDDVSRGLPASAFLNAGHDGCVEGRQGGEACPS
jgi:hypothetical protein